MAISTSKHMIMTMKSSSNEKIKTNSGGAAGDWSAVPLDVLRIILAKVNRVENCIRFSYTCRRWNEVVQTTLREDSHPSPWLMLATKHKRLPGSFTKYLFYCYATGKVFPVQMEYIPPFAACWGSSYGWLVVNTFPDLILFNPLTTASVRLRSPTPMLHRAILTGSPVSPDCMVFVIHSVNNNLGFAKLGYGDICWRNVGDQGQWSDVVCFEGSFYGCRSSGQVLVLRLTAYEAYAVDFAAPPTSVSQWDNTKKYLVDLGGELCLVVRQFGSWNTNSTCGFEVHKIDMCTKSWTRFTSLGDDRLCLFVGGNYAFATEASDNLMPNCIYYTEDFEKSGKNDTGVYQIENDKPGKPLPTPPRVTPPDDEYVAISPIWIIPSLYENSIKNMLRNTSFY